MSRRAQVSRRLVFFRLSAETSQYNPNKIQSALIQSRDEEKSMRVLLHQLLNERTGHVGRHLQIAMDQRAIVQDRLGSVQGGNVRTLEEFPDRNLLAPEQRLLHGGHPVGRSEEHTSELQSLRHLVCRLLLEKKKNTSKQIVDH